MSILLRSAAVAVLSVSVAAGIGAQDTTFRGITIGGAYDPLRDKIAVAILPIGGAFGDSVRTIISRDLDWSDRFLPVAIDSTDPRTYRMPGAAAGLNYPLLARSGAHAAVEITIVPAGLHVALHDVARASVINVGEFAIAGNALGRDWRLGVHRVSDEIERWISGQRGISATRIVYLRAGSLRIIDSDGANEISVPTEENGYGAAWSPNGALLAYNTYGYDSRGQGSRLLLLDLASGRSRVLVPSMRDVTLVSPTFSPDGQTVVYTRAIGSGSDIFSVDVSGSDAPRQLTTARGSVNTNPTFSPDGRRIAFTTGRQGPPELYIMDSDGSGPAILTNYDFSEKNYRSDPDWSPDGRLMAYQEMMDGRFQIRTIPVSGGTPKVLTSEGENQQPSWAPDGRHLVFASDRTGAKQLWVMDTESGRLRQLTKSAGPKLAAWSPRLTAP